MKILFDTDELFELAEAVYVVSNIGNIDTSNHEKVLEEVINYKWIRKSLVHKLEKVIDKSEDLMKFITQLILSNKVSFDDLYNFPIPESFESNSEWNRARLQIAEPIIDSINSTVKEINLKEKKK